MKIAPAKKRIDSTGGLFRALPIIFLFSISACTPPEGRELERANNEAAKGHHREALNGFDHVLKRAPESFSAVLAAREGVRITVFELKDYKKAIEYLHYLILHSDDSVERAQSQKQLAAIYFENLQDYSAAVVEYGRLLGMNPPLSEASKIKIAMARANFYLGQFEQAESEVEDLLKERLQNEIRFDALALKGNILVAKKKFPPAIEIYRKLLAEFPERSKQENIALQLAVCYEENQDFKSAISVVESLKGRMQPEYIELRIKRLQERMRNQPGAKGYRK